MRSLKIGKHITDRTSTSIDKYLSDIQKIPLVSPDEEVILANRIKSGDSLALEKLVKSNLRFVVSVAKQYQNYGLSLGDLINEGNLGLIKAANRFDPSRGFKFISYGVWWIRQSILQAISEQSRMVRLPANRQGAINKINKTISLLEQQYNRAPTINELSITLNIPENEIDLIIQTSSRQVSIDAPLSEDNDNCLSDILHGNSETSPDYSFNSDSLKADIQRALVYLQRRKALVLIHYFGLNGHQPESLEDIAFRLKLTRERVRQLKDAALKEIRKTPMASGLKDYISK